MVKTVTTTTIHLSTDLTSAPSPDASGVLTASQPHRTFCWIQNSTHLIKAEKYLVSRGYSGDSMVFIPYSSRENWGKRYGYIHFQWECDDRGEVVEMTQPLKMASSTPRRSKAGRKAGIETTTTVLTNTERDILHIELYKYFSWLQGKLKEVEEKHAGKRTLLNACASSDGVGRCLAVLGDTFKILGENSVINNEEEPSSNQHKSKNTMPLLEQALTRELSTLASCTTLKGKSHTREYGTFENYWKRLMEFREKFGHSNVPVRYKEDMKLGKWVSNIRQKRKSMESQKELEETTDNVDGESAEQPKKRSRPAQIGAVTLTPERLDMFNAIDFSWDLTGPTQRQSWDVRFQQLLDYYNQNGKWPPHSDGTLGEWVHKQRCKWAKKDRVFMEKHFHKLEEVGFLWKVKDRQSSVPWETRIEQLAEFGRLNGHYEVPNPIHDDMSKIDNASVEATRFYKWVNSLHTEYEIYQSGETSKLLDDDRVLQLIKMGFKFREI